MGEDVSGAEVPSHADLALLLLVAERNTRLTSDLADLSLRETPLRDGYSRIDGLAFPMLLVDLTTLAERVRNDYVALFTEKVPLPPGVAEWWYAHFGPMKEGTMDPTRL